MRPAAILLASLMLIGCAAPRGAAPVAATPHFAAAHAPAAAALVFDPPASQSAYSLNLWRDAREPAAFLGFDQSSTTVSYIRTDDRQTNDGNDRFERRAIIEHFGVSSR